MYLQKRWRKIQNCFQGQNVVVVVCVYVCVLTTRHICQRTEQDASPPLTPPLIGPDQGVEERGKKARWGGECSRGVLYCSSKALWWQAGGHFSLLANRCIADGIQGYACAAALTGWSIEDAGACSPRDNDWASGNSWPRCPVMVFIYSYITFMLWLEHLKCFWALKYCIFLLLHCTYSMSPISLFLSQWPVIFCQTSIVSEVEGKCRGDVWHMDWQGDICY